MGKKEVEEVHKQDVIEAFKKAVDKNPISNLEISWSLQCSVEELQLILEGKKAITEKQELEMLRFCFKQSKIDNPQAPTTEQAAGKN